MVDVLTGPERLAIGSLEHADGGNDPLSGFHPAVAEWFGRRFPDGPTSPQAKGWPLISAGLDP